MLLNTLPILRLRLHVRVRANSNGSHASSWRCRLHANSGAERRLRRRYDHCSMSALHAPLVRKSQSPLRQRFGGNCAGEEFEKKFILQYLPSQYCIDELARCRDKEGSSAANETENPLEHLAAILRSYSKQTFARDTQQWLRCVIKYAHDAGLFADQSTPDQVLLLLAEVRFQAF